MPTRVFVHIHAGRSLPVMDRATGLTDAYVKPQLKGIAFDPQQTSTARKTLNPVWDQQCKCDVTDDCLLQDEPLQLRVFDYDVLSADDVIGTVYVHLNSLYEGVDRQQRRTEEGVKKQKKKISGWFPIYDTLRGICGELQVTVYIAHIMDHNPVEDSSVGVQVLSASTPPDKYTITECLGLVDELLVEDDPESNWQDTFRSSRSSNDARQLLFHSMDGKLRRQIGRKVTDIGGNALLGYQTHFDLENNFIIARGIGTAVTLQKQMVGPAESGSGSMEAGPAPLTRHLSKSLESEPAPEELGSSESVPSSGAPSGAPSGHLGPMRGEPEALMEPLRELEPLTQAQLRTLQRSKRDKRERFRANMRQEVLLFSLQEFLPGVIVVLGGMVAARSVKVIGQEGKTEKVVEVRDAWWNELRAEIKSHARSLDCCHVVGYSETATISEDGVCVLSASGTAAVLDQGATPALWRSLSVTHMNVPGAGSPSTDPAPVGSVKPRAKRDAVSKCALCHIPYSHRSPPFSMRLVLCNCCGNKYVPDVLLATVEVPEEVAIEARGQLFEVHVCRARQVSKNLNNVEYNATRVSELMPFMEFDLHKQIMSKLKLRAHNAVFGLRTVLSIGEGMVTCVATGTSVLLSALPIPQPLAMLRTDVRTDFHQTSQQVKLLMAESSRNQQHAQKRREEAKEQAALSQVDADESSSDSSDSSSDDSEEGGNKPPPYVLEIDDDQGERDLVALWEEPLACVEGVCSTGRMPFAHDKDAPPRGLDNLQLLTLFRRVTLTHPKEFGSCLTKLYQEVLLSLCLRLRSLSNSIVLCGLKTHISLHEDNTLQLGIVTMSQVRSEAVPDGHPASPTTEERCPRKQDESGTGAEEGAESGAGAGALTLVHGGGGIGSQQMPAAPAGLDSKEGKGWKGRVELTVLSYIPGARVVQHIDRILVCMIREVIRINEDGNLSTWTSRLLLEGQAMCRAQAAAMGGNAVLHYNVEQMIVNNITHKMRVYSVLMVTGDVVKVQLE